jgi:hypothetical protein
LFIIPDLLSFLLPALEEQLVASYQEMKKVHLREVILMEDRERAVVAEI